MVANVETMFYTRTKPWHGLGNHGGKKHQHQGAALELAGPDWRVVQKKSGDRGRDHRSGISGKSKRDR